MESEKKYSTLVESLQEGVWIIDKDGNTSFVNSQMAKMLGYTVEEIQGRHLFSFLDKEGVKLWGNLIKQRMQGIKEQHDFEFCKKDGTRMHATLEISPLIDESGNYAGAIVGVIDITKWKRLQEQFFQSQKMEAIGSLAGSVAHDFNNILTAIVGFATFVRDGLPSDHPNREDIEEIINVARSAMSLTSQLLAFSRRQVIVPQKLQIDELITNLQKMLMRLIGENIELIVQSAPGLWPVKADPGMIEQLVINLAVNAHDAMPNGGRLTIKSENVTIDEEFARMHIDSEPGDYVMLVVSDTGCGMTEKVKSHLFEPFFTTKEAGKGTGLGLSTVYGIVKRHRGFIYVYSEPGHGASFRIYLPRMSREDDQTILEKQEDAQLSRGTETVLVVEDAQAVRHLEVKILRNLGYNVLEAANGKEALRLSNEYSGTIHILLSDVVMPILSGQELYERFREKRPGTKVLFTSGYTDDNALYRKLIERKIPFLQKPFTAESLSQKIRELLDKRQE